MIADFFKGLSYTKAGFKFIHANKSLYKFIIIPTLINLILFLGLAVFMFHYYPSLYSYFDDKMGQLTTTGEGWVVSFMVGVIWVFSAVLKILLGLLLVALMVFAMFVLAQMINSPFYELLSEACEEIIQGKTNENTFSFARLFKDIQNTLIIELKKVLFFISIPILLLVLNIVPLIGSLLYTILTNLFAAWAFGFNYLSFPMTRKQVQFGTQLNLSRRFKAQLIGLGAPLMIPFFNLLFGPIFVVGGTLLYLDLQEDLEA